MIAREAVFCVKCGARLVEWHALQLGIQSYNRLIRDTFIGYYPCPCAADKLAITSLVPTEEEYLKAKAVVDAYDAEQARLLGLRVRAFMDELKQYFREHEIIKGTGIKIEEFSWENVYCGVIIPRKPDLEDRYEGDCDEDIQALCAKHQVKFKFPNWVYHKST